jgi:hypothetical protein
MRLVSSIRNLGFALSHGPLLIALGLTFLTAAMLWRGVPAVTAMALVAFGATSVTLARFRRTPAILPIMLAHLAIYGGLYALFIGATLHAAARPGTGLSGIAIVDLALSGCLFAIALERVWCELRTGHAAE